MREDWDEGELRDRLPLLAAGTLPTDEAAALRARVATDADLADELALLGALRSAHLAAPAVDVARIVAALPAPVAARPSRVRAGEGARLLRVARIAAAAAVVAVGGLATWMGTTRPAGAPSAMQAASAELRLGIPLDGLSDDQLDALAAEIRDLDGLPSEEPEVGA